MKKKAQNSKFVRHSIEIIRQSKIKGSLLKGHLSCQITSNALGGWILFQNFRNFAKFGISYKGTIFLQIAPKKKRKMIKWCANIDPYMQY